MKIILKQELFVEGKNGMTLIPEGTRIIVPNKDDNGNDIHQQIQPDEEAVLNAYVDVLNKFIPDQLVVVKNNLVEGTDEIEGQQTDVDDFDVHSVDTVSGTVVFEVSIPKEVVPFKFSAADALDESSPVERFTFWADIPEFDDIEEYLAEKADVSLWGKRSRDDEHKVSSYISQKTTDNALVIGIRWDISLTGSISGDNLVHKGRYRRGGSYPDA
jgi:hypothetical protein